MLKNEEARHTTVGKGEKERAALRQFWADGHPTRALGAERNPRNGSLGTPVLVCGAAFEDRIVPEVVHSTAA